jgi:hypothetical protein
MRFFSRRTGIAAFALTLCVHAHHAIAARLALVVGNDQYQYVEKLRNARNDARLMSATLKEAGFEVTQVEDATRDGLWSAIEAFKLRINKGDEVVFYFSGHGVQIGSTPVLLPIDIRAQSDSQVQRDGVPIVDIQDALKDARFSLLVIDACRDNPFPKVGTRSVGATRGLMPIEPAQGAALIMSAGRGQKALDEVPGDSVNNGLFTYEFVRVIKRPGVDVSVALKMVRDQVEDKAKTGGNQQRPSIAEDMRGNFYIFANTESTINLHVASSLSPPSMSASPVRLQTSEEIEQQAWEDAQKAKTASALNAYLQEYPQGRFAKSARIGLAALLSATSAGHTPATKVDPGNSVDRQTLTAVKSERRVALVIGNDRYRGYQGGEVSVSYARQVEETLKAVNFHVISGFDVNHRQTLELLSEFQANLRRGDIAVVYFSGGGLTIDGSNFFLPIGWQLTTDTAKNFNSQALDVELTIVGTAKRAGVGLLMVFVDTMRQDFQMNPALRKKEDCTYGASQQPGALKESANQSVGAVGTSQSRVSAAGALIAYATTSAWPCGYANGRFTNYLLKAMRTPNVNIREAMKWVAQSVSAESNGGQVPSISATLTGQFSFTVQ